ncbi:unnamed protein product [Soboliphyme baturini]|uniref:Uncharacterized protein n=1 Tax=Soboliphyme baturini TaxID=241478 RepID=A0A183J5T9_9BILA|nr:unnamed protein product [Soboliphyme baturini]
MKSEPFQPVVSVVGWDRRPVWWLSLRISRRRCHGVHRPDAVARISNRCSISYKPKWLSVVEEHVTFTE